MEAFTIGWRRTFDRALAEGRGVVKAGQRSAGSEGFAQDYEGGWVWPTREAAVQYLEALEPPLSSEGWGIYVIELPGAWEVVTERSDDDGLVHLVVDAPILRAAP